jgi:hypothetical protein
MGVRSFLSSGTLYLIPLELPKTDRHYLGDRQ